MAFGQGCRGWLRARSQRRHCSRERRTEGGTAEGSACLLPEGAQSMDARGTGPHCSRHPPPGLTHPLGADGYPLGADTAAETCMDEAPDIGHAGGDGAMLAVRPHGPRQRVVRPLWRRLGEARATVEGGQCACAGCVEVPEQEGRLKTRRWCFVAAGFGDWARLGGRGGGHEQPGQLGSCCGAPASDEGSFDGVGSMHAWSLWMPGSFCRTRQSRWPSCPHCCTCM